jgi:hypothetical protein
MVNYEALKYALALRQIKGIGDIVFKRLAPTPEHAEVLFKMAQKKRLQKGVSEKLRTALFAFNDWSNIESTIQVCIDHQEKSEITGGRPQCKFTEKNTSLIFKWMICFKKEQILLLKSL